jgi:hypothetical protein
MQLNSFAGRTYNDLDQVCISNFSAVISRLFSIFCHCCVAFAWQYFVLPWVLRDYTSLRLDLTDQACYRDLSRPVGAQTEARRQLFRERYACWPDPEVGYHRLLLLFISLITRNKYRILWSVAKKRVMKIYY